MWGWSVDFATAMKLLSRFVDSGHSHVDTATNYPINGLLESNGLALKWIGVWLKCNPGVQLDLIVKVGSVNNLGGAENDVSSLALTNQYNQLVDKFGGSLSCFMVHWDNRSQHDLDDIGNTVDVMRKVRAMGHHIGFSGVKNPNLYAMHGPDLVDSWIIEVKENVVDKTARLRCQEYFRTNKYYVYGINGAGSISCSKSSTAQLRGLSLDLNLRNSISATVDIKPHGGSTTEGVYSKLLEHFALSNDISGVIVGPRNLNQLDVNLNVWDFCNRFD